MTIENPEVTTTQFQEVKDLEERIIGAMEIGVVCHCTSLIRTRNGWAVRWRDDDNVTHSIGNIILRRIPSEGRVRVKRVISSVIGDKLPNIDINVSDTDEAVRLKLFDVIDGIRVRNGIIASEDDVQALKEAIAENY